MVTEDHIEAKHIVTMKNKAITMLFYSITRMELL